MPKVIGIVLGFLAFMIVALLGGIHGRPLEESLTLAFYALLLFVGIGYWLGIIGVKILEENFDDITMRERENELSGLRDRFTREEEKRTKKREEQEKVAKARTGDLLEAMENQEPDQELEQEPSEQQ